MHAPYRKTPFLLRCAAGGLLVGSLFAAGGCGPFFVADCAYRSMTYDDVVYVKDTKTLYKRKSRDGMFEHPSLEKAGIGILEIHPRNDNIIIFDCYRDAVRTLTETNTDFRIDSESRPDVPYSTCAMRLGSYAPGTEPESLKEKAALENGKYQEKLAQKAGQNPVTPNSAANPATAATAAEPAAVSPEPSAVAKAATEPAEESASANGNGDEPEETPAARTEDNAANTGSVSAVKTDALPKPAAAAEPASEPKDTEAGDDEKQTTPSENGKEPEKAAPAQPVQPAPQQPAPAKSPAVSITGIITPSRPAATEPAGMSSLATAAGKPSASPAAAGFPELSPYRPVVTEEEVRACAPSRYNRDETTEQTGNVALHRNEVRLPEKFMQIFK